jgi:Type IV leader peptidase family
MTELLTVLAAGVLGMSAAWVLMPLTRRELSAAMARASIPVAVAPTQAGDAGNGVAGGRNTVDEVRISTAHRIALVVASGVLPAYVIGHVGWAAVALPPLLLLVGLVQLGYCDLTRRLLPKTLVYLLTVAVVASGVVVAGFGHEWERLLVATLGSLTCFALFFVINLLNPNWLAFGDVRLSLVVGFGLAWVSPVALLEGFLVANLLAAFVGLALIAGQRASRRSAVPFGLYLAARGQGMARSATRARSRSSCSR